MKVTIKIKKTNCEEQEIPLPAFFKKNEVTFIAVFTDKCITTCVCNSGIMAYDNINAINLDNAEEINRHEWLDVYESTKLAIRKTISDTNENLASPFATDDDYGDLQMKEFDRFMTNSNNYHDLQNEKRVHRELERQF